MQSLENKLVSYSTSVFWVSTKHIVCSTKCCKECGKFFPELLKRLACEKIHNNLLVHVIGDNVCHAHCSGCKNLIKGMRVMTIAHVQLHTEIWRGVSI